MKVEIANPLYDVVFKYMMEDTGTKCAQCEQERNTDRDHFTLYRINARTDYGNFKTTWIISR